MNAAGFLAAFDTLDAKLVAKGFPATSPWWRSQLERFVRSGRRTFVLRVGRRGGKSSTLCRVAVALAMFGGMSVPPGDVLTFAFISVSRDEAASRLRTIGAILDALGLTYKPAREGHGHELDARPIAFRVFTASIAGVSGPTCGAVFCDEVAKWKDADTGSNPATEVLASVRPTLATTKGFLFLSSSPLSKLDAHFDAFERGDTEAQITAHAPTWTANPTITEADTRALEPDPRVWLREYAAVPSAASSAAFDPDAIDRAFRRKPGGTYAAPARVLDPSSGGKDSWTWCRVRWTFDESGRYLLTGNGDPIRLPDGRALESPDWKPTKPILSFDQIRGVEGRFWDQLSGDEIVDRVSRECSTDGTRHVHADQREALMLRSAFERRHLRYCVHTWTSPTKTQAVEQVRRWFAEGMIALEPHDKLRRELLAFEEKWTSAGTLTFGARGSGHDDYVALLLTAAMADASEDPGEGLSRSPFRRPLARGIGQRPVMPF